MYFYEKYIEYVIIFHHYHLLVTPKNSARFLQIAIQYNWYSRRQHSPFSSAGPPTHRVPSGHTLLEGRVKPGQVWGDCVLRSKTDPRGQFSKILGGGNGESICDTTVVNRLAVRINRLDLKPTTMLRRRRPKN